MMMTSYSMQRSKFGQQNNEFSWDILSSKYLHDTHVTITTDSAVFVYMLETQAIDRDTDPEVIRNG